MHDVVTAAKPTTAAQTPVTAHIPIMTLASVRKSFGSVQALKGVDVLIMPGEVHAIVGETGAGKSTLIAIAAGVLRADAGAIYCDGKYVKAPSPRLMLEDGVAVVHQHPALAPDLTVLETLQLAAPQLAAAEAERLLARIATAEVRMPVNRRVAELSLAQRHVVEIARALAAKPKVLFLDEPTEPLQRADVRKLFDLIGELKRDGVAIVYVCHRLHEVDELADRISVMRAGEIIDSRPARAITHDVVTAAKPIAVAQIPDTAHIPVMTLASVRKSFGPVQALKGVDVLIMPGEVHAIVGENGAGKSTLIAIAAGVLRADAGAIYYDGKYVKAPTPRLMLEDGVAVVYQHPALAPDLTVLENLQLAAPQLAAAGGAAEAERLLARIATADLRMPVNRRVAELSLAQRHIVEIARALAAKPKVLFLDEPTEPLQHADVRKLFGLIGELKRDGVAIVYVSHRLHEVDELADRVSVMRDGEIIDSRPAQAITPAEIVALIAGRPLGQIFPAKATAVGAPVFAVKGLSGRGFDQVDLVVHAGEIVGLAGVEGEGQREFIRAAAGIDRRHGGEVRVKDAPITGEGPGAFRQAGVGFVSDDRHAEGVFLNLTLRENFSLGFLGAISRHGVIERAEEAKRAKAIIDDLRIRAASSEAKLNELSGGNQQKALLGREISAQPSVLLVDEPTKGVDVGARSEIYQRLRAIADRGVAVLVSSSDGIELEGLCDRVLIFARGRIVRELTGADVTDAAITEANLTATASRAAKLPTAGSDQGWRKFFGSDHLPALVLLVLTVVILGGTQAINGYFLSPISIKSLLTFFSIVAFISSAQLATVLVGAIDLSIGPLAGLCVVLASFLIPDGVATGPLAAGVIFILISTIAFGLLQGLLITSLRLPAIVVTIATFIGLQGVSLLLRPTAAGVIDDAISDATQLKLWFVPAGTVLTLAMVGGAEWLLYRTAFGRSYRAVGSSPLASYRLGINATRLTWLAFVFSGFLTGVGGLMLAGQVGIGSPSTGSDYTLMSITVLVLSGASVTGGRGSFVATLCGAALVQATSSASSYIDANSSVHYGVIGALTLAAAIFFSIVRRRAASG
jgi:ribose transport system ATP-binding protein